VRYAGVLGAASKWRALVVPPLPEADPGTTNSASPPPCESRPKKPPTHRSGYRPWAELMKRSFALDVETCTSSVTLLRHASARPTCVRSLRSSASAPPTDNADTKR